MTTHAPGTWFLAPSTDRSDEWAAGYDGNTFATREEAEASIPDLQACDEGFAAIEWVAAQRSPSYQWSTDSASGTVVARDAQDALRQLIAQDEWPARDASVIRDGGWIWIRSEQADDEIQRGEMP